MKPKKIIPRLYIINDTTVLRIVPTLAEEIGLNESVMLLQIDFLKSISNTQNKKGRPWTFQSIRQMQDEYFPFWSKDTINRTIASLQKMRLIRCGNFNKAAYDRTRWISINYAKASKLQSVQVNGLSHFATVLSQDATRSTQNATTIPETPTETPADTKNDGAFSMLPQRLSGKGKIVKQKDEEAYADFETFCTFWESMTGQDYRKQKPGYYFGARKKYGVEALHAALKGYAGSEWHKEKRAWNLGKFFRDDVYKYMPKKEQDATVWDWTKLPADLHLYQAVLVAGDRYDGTWFMTAIENVSPSFVEAEFKKHGISVKVTKKEGV